MNMAVTIANMTQEKLQEIDFGKKNRNGIMELYNVS